MPVFISESVKSERGIILNHVIIFTYLHKLYMPEIVYYIIGRSPSILMMLSSTNDDDDD